MCQKLRFLLVNIFLVVCFLVVNTLLSGCALDDEGSFPEPSGLTVTSLPWISVEGHRLKDSLGREWQFRGINARIEGLFDVTFDDGRTALEPIPAFTESDARAMATQGFNFLRLPINWSGLEPQEGKFSATYLEKLDSVIALCRKWGIYVLVDFHQDAWSKEIGEDGAPLWAIIPPPTELLEGPLTDLDARRASAQVLLAFQSFFQNVENLRSRFQPAWRRIVSRYKNEPAVAGFQPMNEPLLVHFDRTQGLLHDFYRECMAAMEELDVRQTLWVEPDSARNFLSTAPILPEAFPFPNIVYAPHLYPRGRTFTTVEGWRGFLQDNISRMKTEADSWGGALVLGEWGIHPNDDSADSYMQAVQELFEEYGSGQAFWVWKERSQGFWGFYDYDETTGTWQPRSEGFRKIDRPYVLAVPGRFLSHRFNPETNVLQAIFQAVGHEGPPVLYLPQEWFPNGVRITLNDQPVEVPIDPATQRTLLPWDGAAGEFDIIVNSK